MEVLRVYGLALFFAGAVITILSALVAYTIGRYIFKLNIIDLLAAITGAMTSTPGLGTVINAAGNPSMAASYASTYPMALFIVVLFIQVLSSFT